MRPLPESFFRRPADLVARDLLGTRIASRVRGQLLTGVITETEAYLGADDPASHAFQGRRHAGNLSLYSPPGTWYVYRSYGIHWCANLVCGAPAAGAAVLLRGIVPVEGVPLMRRNRRDAPERDLANGPGKLCQALAITRGLDGRPMRTSSVLVGGKPGTRTSEVVITPRVGISRAVDWPLRFALTRAGQEKKGPALRPAPWFRVTHPTREGL